MKKENDLIVSEKVELKINKFFENNRKTVLIASGAVLIVFILICSIAVAVQNKTTNLFNSLMNLEIKYQSYVVGQSDWESVIEEADALIKKAGKKYPGAKAALIKADILFDEGKFEEAGSTYEEIYSDNKSTYIGAIGLVNAAASYESAGDSAAALSLYNKLFSEYGEENVYASRALFNSARLYEAEGSLALAKATFEQLIGLYPSSEYSKLAKAHLLYLK